MSYIHAIKSLEHFSEYKSTNTHFCHIINSRSSYGNRKIKNFFFYLMKIEEQKLFSNVFP